MVGLTALALIIQTAGNSESGILKSEKFFEYVVIPTAAFIALLLLVIFNWNSSAPWWGESAWWGSTGRQAGVVILGMIPSLLCFGALFPLTRLADQKNHAKPLETFYGRIYVMCLILAAILLPLGIAAAVLFDKYYLGG